MISHIDLAAVELELLEKLSNGANGTPTDEYQQGFKDGLEWAQRRIRWLHEGRYELARLQREGPK